MKKIIRYTGNFILMLILIVSTSGFTIYRLHCQCTQRDYFSVFHEIKGCQASHTEETHHCCCANSCKNETSVKKACHHGDSCNTSKVHFAKLSADFLGSLPLQIEKAFPLEMLSNLTGEIIPKVQVSPINDNLILVDFSPPITDTGKKIITLFHQFKFDDLQILS